jgi:hypothetical protein
MKTGECKRMIGRLGRKRGGQAQQLRNVSAAVERNAAQTPMANATTTEIVRLAEI